MQSCIYCGKECKSSDSRPYPNSKSQNRIHNRCYIKKTLADKQNAPDLTDKATTRKSFESQSSYKSKEASTNLMDMLVKEQEELKKAAEVKRLNKMIENKQQETEKNRDGSSQFFFDVKAGIAKPHEKRRYLHHRNLSEIAARFDDNGFQQDSLGRSYDHEGKDLDTLGDVEEKGTETESERRTTCSKISIEDRTRREDRSTKRKSDSRDDIRVRVKRVPQVKVGDQNPCWFCLSSPTVEKHLIVAIGEFCYMTLAKGGLTDEHLLLVPIEHVQSLSSEDNSNELMEELEKFKGSLVKYFEKQSRGVIFFERNFRSVHWQLQVVPIPLSNINELPQKIKSISANYFDDSDYIDIPDSCSLRDIIPPKAPYFFWQIEPLGQRFACQIRVKSSFFPIQLGRMVLADPNILNCPDRIDWKQCAKNKEEYVELVKMIKEKYGEFDITEVC